MPGVRRSLVDEDRNKIIGMVLRECRVDAGLSATQVGDRIGAGASIVTSYERGERTVSVERLVDLAGALETNLRLLVGVIDTRAQQAAIV